MSHKPTTIDSIGIEASQRYALDQKANEAYRQEQLKGIKEAPGGAAPSVYLPQQVVIDVTSPALAPAEKMFEISRHILWSNFPHPPSFSTARLFLLQLAPSLGTADTLQDLKERFIGLKNTLPTNAAVQESYKRLSTLIEQLHKLQRTLDDIKAGLNAFQRG
jgi:hypothetical protein